jgi:hypothetical protein
MPGKKPDFVGSSRQHQMALSRWDTEGGAGPSGPQEVSTSGDMQSEVPRLTNVELVQLRIRVIALENLVIALLAESSDRQLNVAREMAAYISPRSGSAHHPLTIQASAQMVDLVERARLFRVKAPS